VQKILRFFGCGPKNRYNDMDDKFSETSQGGSASLFNGISMALAVYFPAFLLKFGPLSPPVWAILMSLFENCLGRLNVCTHFPEEVKP
jgi:hypothetical protein